MTIPFVDRDPSEVEVERFRLLLSTYQDGSGQQVVNGQTVPGWRDYERTVAVAFGGLAQENKFIFDVLLPDLERPGVYFGVSCKMRRTLNDTKRTKRVTLELSNSSGKFWDRLGRIGIHQQNYRDRPIDVGQALLDQENEWHAGVDLSKGNRVDLASSFYLALSWSAEGEYQLFKFPLTLPAAGDLKWDFPRVKRGGEEGSGRRLRGQDPTGTLFEWYGESGGQLKYYPRIETSLWKSQIFCLEPLPSGWEKELGILGKARNYFPKHRDLL